MFRKRIAALVIAALLITAAFVTGCSLFSAPTPTKTPSAAIPSTPTETTQTSVEPTSTATSKPKNAGPITTPPAGSEERTALLDAARAKLGTSSQFYVYQLYVQGDTALADLDPVKTSAIGRVFVAWIKENGTWHAIGATRFGSASANAADTARALPDFSAALIDKIDWKLAIPKKTTSASQSTLKSDLSASATSWAKNAMQNANVASYKVTTLKIAQDKNGDWWGHAVVLPKGSGGSNYESLNIWAKYSGGAWSGKIQDPEPPAPSTYFPSEVISKLGPL